MNQFISAYDPVKVFFTGARLTPLKTVIYDNIQHNDAVEP